MSLQYKLLWLKGPLKGRELQLPSGQLTIGSDGDILAKLDGTEEITLNIDDSGIHLISNVAGTIDAHEGNFESPLPYQKAIEVAGVAFVVAPVEESLSLIELPSAPVSDTQRVIKNIETDKKPNKTHWGLLSLAVILAISIFYIMTLPEVSNEKKQTIQEWTKGQRVKEALPNIKITWSSNTRVTLSGYYDDPINFTAFLASLRSKNILYIQDAIYLTQLISNVRMILAENHYNNLQVTLDKKRPGNIYISGAIQSGEQWNETAKMLKNIHGLKEWKVTNQASHQVKQLITLLRTRQLLEGIMITRVNETIRVIGQVSNKNEIVIKSIIQQVQDSNAGIYKINFLNIPIHDELSKLLPSEIVSIGGNNSSPYIELANGDRLWKKTRLDNGYIIDFIDEYGIDLSHKGEVIHVPFIF